MDRLRRVAPPRLCGHVAPDGAFRCAAARSDVATRLGRDGRGRLPPHRQAEDAALRAYAARADL
eukprot:4834137-Heterocapsa_arctica.AAC.1